MDLDSGIDTLFDETDPLGRKGLHNKEKKKQLFKKVLSACFDRVR